MECTILPIERAVWIEKYQEVAHQNVFGVDLPAQAKQSFFDKAFVVLNPENEPVIYATVKQLTEKALFIEFGGSFPDFRGSRLVLPYFRELCDYFKEAGAEVVSLTTMNTNVAMQKLALSVGFLPIGMSLSPEGLMIDFTLNLNKGE